VTALIARDSPGLKCSLWNYVAGWWFGLRAMWLFVLACFWAMARSPRRTWCRLAAAGVLLTFAAL
jgi:hypothetical protein